MTVSVVIVDDSETERYVVKRRLSRAGGFCNVWEAPSGAQFLDDHFSANSNTSPDVDHLLVLMDINMPRMSGFDTVERMEALMAEGQGPKECSVIVCTSSENPSDKLKSQEFQSIKGYIVKPIDKSDIADLTKTIRA